jgi:hypothetical protein
MESTVFWHIMPCIQIFQKNILPPSSGSKSEPSKQPARSVILACSHCSDHEDRGDEILLDYKATSQNTVLFTANGSGPQIQHSLLYMIRKSVLASFPNAVINILHSALTLVVPQCILLYLNTLDEDYNLLRCDAMSMADRYHFGGTCNLQLHGRRLRQCIPL